MTNKNKGKGGKAVKYVLNEEYIFGGRRCWGCGKVMGKKEKGFYCEECRKKAGITGLL